MSPSPSPSPTREPLQPCTDSQPIQCEFTPCKTPPTNEPTPRKIISHIFGRNKTLTKRVPPHVWVHYCRQHYQRARYRARDWPVTQCLLVLVSLERMGNWGGIRGFRVVLRRRVLNHPRPPPSERERSRSPVGGRYEDGRGRGVTRSSISTSVSVSTSTGSSTSRPTSQDSSPSPSPPKRKKPTIPPSPVPAWLRAETHPTNIRSFEEVRGIVERLKGGFEQQREDGSAGGGRFPDIEILPVFWE